jgi:hypothetical protein
LELGTEVWYFVGQKTRVLFLEMSPLNANPDSSLPRILLGVPPRGSKIIGKTLSGSIEAVKWQSKTIFPKKLCSSIIPCHEKVDYTPG